LPLGFSSALGFAGAGAAAATAAAAAVAGAAAGAGLAAAGLGAAAAFLAGVCFFAGAAWVRVDAAGDRAQARVETKRTRLPCPLLSMDAQTTTHCAAHGHLLLQTLLLQ
jgi:hypothetical protein